ncbi:MAG: T9SS type A sorting domain-containing protein [Flavobacteriales bacterium]
MKRGLLSVLMAFIAMSGFSQGEDFATATPFTVTCITSFSATGCGATTYNLGATTSGQLPANGTMSNDVWWSFVAPAELVKIKVCSPTFDAAIELWLDFDSMISDVDLTANTGVTGKEYFCTGGLTTGSTYYVRVGRVTGTGAGTFGLSVEHNKVEVNPTYTPAPPGQPCYLPGLSIKRTNTCATPLGSTRWKFVAFDGTETICVGVGDQPIASCGEFCLDGSTYTVYVEVRANDAECGNIFWGYSAGKPMTMCNSTCLQITSPSNNQVLPNFLTTNFSVAGLAGYEYNWRFTTDNGNTQFCSGWITTANFQPNAIPAIANCITFNKIYQVQVKAKYCDSEAEPEWCPPISFVTGPFPYITVSSGNCCLWRNKNGGTINANAVLGVDQYRWRFTPIDPCSANPLQPIGPACATAWNSSSTVNPNGVSCITAGSTYLVQVQGRQLASTCASCTGSSINIPSLQSDWGPACIIAFRTSGSPAVGTPIGCYCTPGMPEVEAPGDELNYVMDYSVDRNMGVMSTTITGKKLVAVDLSATELEGNGLLRIFNMNGQVMYEQNVYDVGNLSYFTIDIETKISAGIYIISVVTDSGAVSDKIMIGQD